MATKVEQGLVFNGTTDYFTIPSITYDCLEIDCMISSKQVFASPFLFRFSGTAFFKYNNNGGYHTINGYTMLNNVPKDERVTLKFNVVQTTTSGYFGGESNAYLKCIIYRITFKLNGNIQAEYDFTTGKATDISGNGNDGILYGSPQWAIKPETQGIQFNGLLINCDSFKLPALDINYVEIDCAIKDISSNIQYIIANNNGFVRINQNSSTLNYGNTTSTGFIIGTRTTIKITLTGTTWNTVADQLKIFSDSSGTTGGTKGIIYEIKCYNNSTLVAYYDFTSSKPLLDLVSGTENGTLTGTQPNIKKAVQGAYFNGIGNYTTADHITVPYSPSLNPSTFTVETWFNPSIFGTRILVNSMTSNSPYLGYCLNVANANVQVGLSSSTKSLVGGRITMYALNHILATYDGSKLTLYVNGVSVATWTGTMRINTSADFTIASGNNSPFGGRIYAVRLFNTALSEQQALQQYDAGIKGNTRTNLMGEWCTDGTGRDTSGNGNHGVVTGTQKVIKTPLR